MKQFFDDNRIGRSLQAVSIFAIVSSFFGFLVVNLFLSFFGFWDYNFLKVQYFSAGGLFLFFICVPAILFYGFFKARDILEKYCSEEKTRIKSFFVFVAKCAVFSLLSYLSYFLVLLPLTYSSAFFKPDFVIFLGILWTALVFGGVATLVKFQSEVTGVRDKMLNWRNIIVYFGAHYRLLYMLFVGPMMLFVFSFFIYPTIPHYFGGGKPVAVSIAFDKNFSANEANITNPLNTFLIYQSTDSMLILTNDGAYQIRRSDVAYIRYLEGVARGNGLQGLINPTSTTTQHD